MDYAIVAWQPPPGANASLEASIAADLLAALPVTRVPTFLLDRVFVYPSPDRGISLATVQSRLLPVVQQHPGTELVITMIPKGNRVVGRFDSARLPTLDGARSIMNQPNALTFPLAL
jgi:hypothetical protein